MRFPQWDHPQLIRKVLVMTSISSVSCGMGSLSQPQRMEGRGKPAFSTIDQDGSGGLDTSEFEALMAKGPMGTQGSDALASVFDSMDGDSDGNLSESELDAGMEALRSSSNGFAALSMDTQAFAGVMGMGHHSPPPPPPGGEQGRTLLSALDSDEAGNSSDEVSALESQMYALMNKLQALGRQQYTDVAGTASVTTSATSLSVTA